MFRKLLIGVVCAAGLIFPPSADAAKEEAPPVAYVSEKRCVPGPPRVETRYDQIEFTWDRIAGAWVVAPKQNVAWSEWQVKRYIYRDTVKRGACG